MPDIKNEVTVDELLKFAPPVADGNDANEQAKLALMASHALIEGYTRGRYLNGFKEYRPGIRAVVLTSSARILANPGQISIRVQAGSVTVSKGVGFRGFTLAELEVLKRYRKKAVGP